MSRSRPTRPTTSAWPASSSRSTASPSARPTPARPTRRRSTPASTRRASTCCACAPAMRRATSRPGRRAIVRSAAARTQPGGFTRNEGWVTGLSSATAFAQVPDGRLFDRPAGRRVARASRTARCSPTPLLTVAVDSSGERGLLGVALHPTSRATASSTSTTPPRRAARTTASAASPPTASRRGRQRDRAGRPATLSGATNHNGGAHALRHRRQALRRRRRERQRARRRRT